MSEKLEDNLKPKKPEDLIQEAKDFSHFEFKFENPSYSIEKIDDIPGLDKFYEEYDEFINQAYLRGKELNDPDFVEKVFQVFPKTHQSGFSMKEFLEKTGEPEVVDLFEKYGQKFLKELTGGGETEIYKQFSCKYKTE